MNEDNIRQKSAQMGFTNAIISQILGARLMLMKDARGQEIGWNAVVIFTYGSELRFGILRDVYGMECGDVVAYNGSGQETAIRCTSNQLMRIRDAQIPTDQIDSVMALRRRLLGKE